VSDKSLRILRRVVPDGKGGVALPLSIGTGKKARLLTVPLPLSEARRRAARGDREPRLASASSRRRVRAAADTQRYYTSNRRITRLLGWLRSTAREEGSAPPAGAGNAGGFPSERGLDRRWPVADSRPTAQHLVFRSERPPAGRVPGRRTPSWGRPRRGPRRPPPVHQGSRTAAPRITMSRTAASARMTGHEGSNSRRRTLKRGARGWAWWLLWRDSPPVTHARRREL